MPTPEIIPAAGSRQTPLVESLDLWSSQEHHRVRLFSSPARYFSQVLSQLLQVGLLPTYSVLLFSLCPSFRPLHLALQSNRPRLLSQSTGSAPLCPCLPIFTLQILSGQVHMPPPPGSLPQHPFRALPSFLLVSLHTHSAAPPPEVLHLKNTATHSRHLSRAHSPSGPGLILNVGNPLCLYFSLVLKKPYEKHKSKKNILNSLDSPRQRQLV